MAAPTTVRAADALGRELPAPTWGDQFGHLRKTHYKSAKSLAEEVTGYGVPTTAATISRIESLDEAPEAPSQRIVAAVVMVLCNFHPAQLGISLDELPLKVYANLFGAPDDPSGLDITPTACNGKALPPRARRAVAASVAA